MAARWADMDAALEAPCLEPRSQPSDRRSRERVLRCVALVQEPIQLLGLMDYRIAYLVAPDQLVLGIRIHVVLVAVKALAVLFRPACILLLSVLRRLLLSILRRLAAFDRLVLLARVARCGHRHDGGIDDLTPRAMFPAHRDAGRSDQIVSRSGGLGELLAEQP